MVGGGGGGVMVFVVALAVGVLGYLVWPVVEETRVYYRVYVWVWKRRKLRKW